MKILTLLMAAILFTGLAGQGSQAAECKDYEPADTVLTGTLQRMTFPGPPNYESVENGDQAETILWIQTAAPICVNPSTDDEFNKGVSDIDAIQLALSPDQYRRFRKGVGQTVTVSGQLFGAQTIHHRTPVLLYVSTLSPATPRGF